MHLKISGLAASMHATGESDRAKCIFDQAMQKGKFLGGSTALYVGGAALAVALRESQKTEALHEIAVSSS